LLSVIELSYKKKSTPLKACASCKALVDKETEICPYCGSREFTEEWSGIIITIDPENSELARILNITGKGRYAVKLE